MGVMVAGCGWLVCGGSLLILGFRAGIVCSGGLLGLAGVWIPAWICC